MHRCSACNESFDATKNRANNLSWDSFLTRPIKTFPLTDDIETFALVKCPKCGHIEDASELRIFGVI